MNTREKVDPRFLVTLDHFFKSEFDIGKFRDIGHAAGVDRFNMAGGAVMEDFDNDGLLDLAVTAYDPTLPMALYRNTGDGTFKERTEAAGLIGQLGGKNLVQTDFNNDGRMDLFISRGAWLPYAMPQSLLAEQRRRNLHRRDQRPPGLTSPSIRPRRAGPITTTTACSMSSF